MRVTVVTLCICVCVCVTELAAMYRLYDESRVSLGFLC